MTAGRLLIHSSLVLAALCAGTSQGAAPVFRAGAFSADVTPLKFPISMNGQLNNQVANSASSRLHARCIVLDDGTSKVAIVVVDSCLISDEIFDEAKARASKATGIAADHMMMSATHTHTGPASVGVFQSEPDKDYVAFLIGQIAEGVIKADANLAPARVGWGSGSDPTQVFCRRWLMKPGTALTNPFGGTKDDQAQMHPGFQNPNAVEVTGPVDPEIGLLSLKRASDGRPIALMANYAMHYVGYGIPAGTTSADYFGRFCERIEAKLGAGPGEGPPFVAALANGTCAETQCFDYSKPKGNVTIETVSASVSERALEAYQTIEYHDWVPLVARETILTIPLRLAGADEVARAKAVLAPIKGRSLQGWEEIYARETVLLSVGPKEARVKLQAMRIGTMGLAAIPNEVYCQTGLAIKEGSPLKPTFINELANGYHGYLTPPDQHKLGGYTAWRARSSCLEVGAEPKVRRAVLDLLKSVAEATMPDVR
ncbi:neutral/alkaline non-lysosomal ceramidase N-terminal domain-containing protein [Isosphaeraceae bacterium EP7]